MSKLRKGQLALFMILAVAVLLIITLFVFKAINISSAIQVKKYVALSMDISDKGTAVFSLLNREAAGKKYIMVLGESVADGYDSSQPAYTSLKETLDKLKGFTFQFQERPDLNKEIIEKDTEKGECGHSESIGDISLVWPSSSTRVTSGFGYRNVPRPCYCHSGLDIASGGGKSDDVKAAYSGTVNFVYSSCDESPDCFQNPKDERCDCQGGLVNRITLKHDLPNGDVFYTHYYHLGEIYDSVRMGETIETGTVMGKTGNTGRSQALHLHFELADDPYLKNEASINPCQYFSDVPTECEQAQILSCTMTSGSNVFSVDIPLPGATDKTKTKVVMEKW